MRTVLARHPLNLSPVRVDVRVTRRGLVLAVQNPDKLPEDFALILGAEDARQIGHNLFSGADALERAQLEDPEVG